MDNLITTVIAIALVGAMAAMGASYGTQAIMTYQANVEAGKIVSDAERIATAWRSYARANNGDPSLNSYCWGSTGATDLVSNYITTLPAPPKGAADSTFTYYFPDSYQKFNITGATTRLGPKYTPADSIALWIKSPRVCQAIVNMAGQTAAVISTSLQKTAGGADINMSTLSTPRAVASPYDCIYNNADGSGGPSQNNTMLFIYRVFDQNNFTTSTSFNGFSTFGGC